MELLRHKEALCPSTCLAFRPSLHDLHLVPELTHRSDPAELTPVEALPQLALTLPPAIGRVCVLPRQLPRELLFLSAGLVDDVLSSRHCLTRSKNFLHDSNRSETEGNLLLFRAIRNAFLETSSMDTVCQRRQQPRECGWAETLAGTRWKTSEDWTSTAALNANGPQKLDSAQLAISPTAAKYLI